MILTAGSFSWCRHTTHYWEAGPVDGPLMIFLHGWPEIGLMWRAQIEAFASEGWRCIAPDMRGYGGSSAPAAPEAYRLNEIVDDLVELHDHLGRVRRSGSAMTGEVPWPRPGSAPRPAQPGRGADLRPLLPEELRVAEIFCP